MFHRKFSAAAVIILGFTAFTGMASAAITTPSNLLPPLAGEYRSPAGIQTIYNDSGLEVVLKDVRHLGFTNIVRTDPICGFPCERQQFNSVVKGLVSVNGSPFSPFELTGLVTIDVFLPNSAGIPFNTEMLQLDLVGTVLGNPVQIRESPTLPSQGVTTITDLGPGGPYRIDSFFDVFTELSLDGGNSWLPSGPTRLELVDTPEPATMSLIGGAMLALGLVYRRRRKA